MFYYFHTDKTDMNTSRSSRERDRTVRQPLLDNTPPGILSGHSPGSAKYSKLENQSDNMPIFGTGKISQHNSLQFREEDENFEDIEDPMASMKGGSAQIGIDMGGQGEETSKKPESLYLKVISKMQNVAEVVRKCKYVSNGNRHWTMMMILYFVLIVIIILVFVL